MAVRVSVIIPARTLQQAAPVLASLGAHAPRDGSWQVLVAVGQSPSAQRNAAAAQAMGEVLLFLDNDCEVDAAYVARVEALAQGQPLPAPSMRQPPQPPPADWQVMGGPVLLPPNASPRQRLFQGLLSHSWIAGPSAARYLPVGIFFRSSSESELILCNLLVKRAFFQQVGPFAETLYPNEENEWLDRAQALANKSASDLNPSTCIYYDPKLTVRRPQPDSWRDFLRMLWRYGMGRTRQLFVQGPPRSWSAAWAKHGVGLLVAFLVVLFLVGNQGLGWFQLACLWVLYALCVAWSAAPGEPRPLLGTEGGGSSFARPKPNPRPWQIGLAAPLVVLAYGLGQWEGLARECWQRVRKRWPAKNAPPIAPLPPPQVESVSLAQYSPRD